MDFQTPLEGGKARRVGVMGGTFDPIHNGHLVTAQEALTQFGLDEIVFLPAGIPPHKEGGSVLPAEERFLMTVIATASNSAFTVSRLEIERPGPTYTIDSLIALRAILGDETSVHFITGADAVWEILTWKNYERLGEYCEFIAATRPGYSLERFMRSHMLNAEGKQHSYPAVHIMEVPALSISSSDIRQRIRESRAVRYLMPEGVVNYINKCEFYRE